MRVAIDLQGIQSEGSRQRGIGRYSFEIVRNIINNYTDNYYILVANAALSDVRHLFNDEIMQDNVCYLEWYSPCPLNYLSKNNAKFIVGKYIRSYFYSNLNTDIILLTSFLEGFSENCLTEIDDINNLWLIKKSLVNQKQINKNDKIFKNKKFV